MTTLWLVLFIAAGLSLLFHACNKHDGLAKTATLPSEPADVIAKTKASIAAQIKKSGISMTVPVNERLEAHWADSSGHTFTQAQVNQMVSNVHGHTIFDAFQSVCDYSNTPSVTLISYTVANDCINGYKVSWTFQVSSNNNIVSANGTTTSKGYLRVYNGTTLVYSTNVTPATVSDQGADPSTLGYELFNVSFTSGYISNSDPYITVTGSSNVKLGGFFVTDCSDLEPITLGIQAYSATNFTWPSGQPCTRIDPIWINSGSGLTLTVFGEDPTGTCTGTGYVYPSWQEVQYSEDGGTTWSTTYLSNTISGCPFANFTGTQYVDPFGIAYLVYDYTHLSSGAHTTLFRTRDLYYTSAGTTSCSGTIVQFPLPPGWGTCTGAWSSSYSYSFTRP